MTVQFSSDFPQWVGLVAAKYAMLKNYPKIRTLCVGSSHGDFGFDPSQVPDSFNLCFRSQDLKHSLHLYRKVSADHPTIENVVLFFSVFSNGSMLEHAPGEREISVALNEIFDLNLTYDDPHLTLLHATVRGKFEEIKAQSVPPIGNFGFIPAAGKSFFPASYGAERRAADHLKFNVRLGALPYLEEMLDLARQNRHRAIIVLAPARADYRQHAGPGSKAFHDVRSIVSNRSPSEVRLLDAYDYEGFDDADFGDTDHLLPLGVGTKHVSRLIRHAVMNPMK